MPRDTVEPTATPVTRPDEGTRYTHPAYAQIGASRVSYGGRGTPLYGSDLLHNNIVLVRIGTSELTRTLSRDWHFSSQPFVEVALSEAAWATFVSSLNIGTGVPATLISRDGQSVPGIPPRNVAHEFKNEARRAMTAAIQELDAALVALGAAPTAAERRHAVERVTKARQHLASNLPFVADQFDRHVEATVEAAKVEAAAYLTAAVQRAGLAALGATPLVELPSPEEDE